MSRNTNILKANINDEFDGLKLNEILTKLMQLNQVSLTELHRNTGIPLPTLKRLQGDSTTNPTITTLLPIAKFFHININQLIGHAPISFEPFGFIEDKANWVKVPLIKWEQILAWPDNISESINQFVFTDAEVSNHAFALRIEEDNWVGFLKGTILIIDPALMAENKDYVIVHKKSQGLPTFKQMLVDEDRKYLKPLDPNFKAVPMDGDYKLLGVLVQVRNDFKS